MIDKPVIIRAPGADAGAQAHERGPLGRPVRTPHRCVRRERWSAVEGMRDKDQIRGDEEKR